MVNRTKYRINVNPGYGEYPMEMSFKFWSGKTDSWVGKWKTETWLEWKINEKNEGSNKKPHQNN